MVSPRALLGEWNMLFREGDRQWPPSRRTFAGLLFENFRGTYTWRDDSRKVPFEEGSWSITDDVLETVATIGESAGEKHVFDVSVDGDRLVICQTQPTRGLITTYARTV